MHMKLFLIDTICTEAHKIWVLILWQVLKVILHIIHISGFNMKYILFDIEWVNKFKTLEILLGKLLFKKLWWCL